MESYAANHAEAFREAIKEEVEDFKVKTGVLINNIKIHRIDLTTNDRPIGNKKAIIRITFEAE